MVTQEEIRPFLGGQRRDVLRELIANRNAETHRRIVAAVSRGLDLKLPKIDGKAGSLDGTVGMIGGGGLADPFGPPICFAYPGVRPKGKDSKDGKDGKDNKEGKDGKEGKEGKDAKDGKEGKEGKESKDGKEGKESKDGKEDKDSSDGFKTGGDEVMNPFSRYGDPAELPTEAFNAIAQAFPTLLQGAITRGNAVF